MFHLYKDLCFFYNYINYENRKGLIIIDGNRKDFIMLRVVNEENGTSI